MATKKTGRAKPTVPKAGVKPKSMGGGRYACGGKLRKKK